MNTVMHFQLADNFQIKEKWDKLVLKHQASIFSESTYLDATADQWFILYNEEETAGMACPFVVKAGIKILVTPFFLRYVEWVGPGFDEKRVFQTLQKEFRVIDLQVKLVNTSGERCFQRLLPGNLSLHQQAKRSLKKTLDFEVTENDDVTLLFELIEKELSPKINMLNSQTLSILQKLVGSYQNKKMHQFNLILNNQWKGGLWLLETETTILYLKGTVEAETKKQGGMYKLMLHAIEWTHQKQKAFDFGGSNMQNVRRFNLSFGAEDVVYSHWKWNNAPFWWNFLRGIKKIWRKK